MADDGPPLIRPVPRRPFDLSLTTPTPPSENSSPPTPAPAPEPNIARFLQPTPEPASAGLSRPQSFMNLTSSTLFGIYSPTTSSSRDRVFADRDELDTPWGTGAQTPIKRPSIDDATFDFLKDRSHHIRRRSSIRVHEPAGPQKHSPSGGALVLRGLLLFVLGVGYGVLVTSRFHESDSLPPRATYNWGHLTFWGLAGVALGALFPWFDRVWDNSFGDKGDEAVLETSASAKDDDPSTDWALAVRAIGAFVGIVLALVNPLLWWLIDRSKPGFLLSAAVGLAGSVVLLGVNPDMMPAPTQVPFRHLVNATMAGDGDMPILGGLAQQKTLETGMWMLSVLFCSCVCFGNIGRRLTLGPSATAKGRWAGVR